jgi:cellulose biosynthesis protein BcsQ
MAKIHIVFTSKGGVGKTTTCTYIIQKLRADGKTVHAYDTDPSNATLASYKGLQAEHINIMNDRGDRIDQSKFDQLINACVAYGEDEYVVIDVGSSNFIELSSYLDSQGLIDALSDMGHEVTLNVIIKSGSELVDTMLAFNDVMEVFGKTKAKIIVWLNEYFGNIVQDGKGFEETKVFNKHKSNIDGIIKIPPPRIADTYGVDLQRMLKEKLTFDEVAESKQWDWLNKKRIYDMKNEIYSAVDMVM